VPTWRKGTGGRGEWGAGLKGTEQFAEGENPARSKGRGLFDNTKKEDERRRKLLSLRGEKRKKAYWHETTANHGSCFGSKGEGRKIENDRVSEDVASLIC